MKTLPVHSQRGAVTLAVTLALLAAMLITLLAANRNLLLELRQSANQADTAAAFEAAEAGLDWAGAMLNERARIGNDCRPSPLATQTFRERHLDTALAAFTPRELRPACVHGPAGWACLCPADAAAAADGSGTAFALRIEAGSQAGQLRVSAAGSRREHAAARHEALFALQPALPFPPATALAVRPAGVGADAFFASLFGLSKAQWARQPAVQALACEGDCSAALRVLAEQGVTLVALPGDATLRGPLVLGTPDRPMLIVAGGHLQLQGAVQLHGVLYAGSLAWAGPAATVRGALVSEGSAGGEVSPDLAHDSAVLDALRTRQGSFVRLPGSWRDF